MSDYLSDEEQVERLKNWWSENGTFLLASVFVAVLGIAGWNYYGSYQEDAGEQSSEVFRQYLDSDSDQREGFLAAIAQEHSGSTAHVLILFDQAEKKFSNGEIFEAEQLLEEALEASEEVLLKDISLIRLAKVQYELEKSEEALAALQKVKTKGFLSWALELKGDIHTSRREIELAHQSYERAFGELEEGVDRPLLKLKLDNASPYKGTYVLPDKQLSQALKEAESVLAPKKSEDQSD